MYKTGSKAGSVGFAVGTLALCMGAASLGTCPLTSSKPVATTVTPIPSATKTPTPQPTSASQTPTVTPTPLPVTLYNATIFGNASVTSVSTYPTDFFTAAANAGDITYSPNGTTFAAFSSATTPLQVTVTAANSLSRPQIQFQIAAAPNLVVFTAPQNTTSNVLSGSFVPNTTSQLRFSIIDTTQPAAGQGYTVLIKQ